MNEQREKLSTLLDEYSGSHEEQAVLDEVIKDVNQQYTARRYQLIGEVMRHEVSDRIQVDFAASVSAMIEQEPAHNAKPAAPAPVESRSGFWDFWFKPVAGMAVAATVAVVAVSLLQPVSESPSAQQLAEQKQNEAKIETLAELPVITPNLSNAVKVSTSSAPVRQPLGTQWNVIRNDPETQAKLNSYLINHHEYSGSMQGIIPQVRVVGYDVNQ